MLTTGDAVAAILCLEDGRYLLQLRDDRADIWFPGCWGCFGGAVDDGETVEEALRRELYEELELRPRRHDYALRFDFGLEAIGFARCHRTYFRVPVSEGERATLVLHEGQRMAAMDLAEFEAQPRVAPYDAFALRLVAMADARARASLK